mmetsp:Transcript_70734/g.160657  ORF Transcript_70734/g.160657 Transcript_70734/m.160657 type:complete len:370 (-) Transcript_70734:8-1117(-)
MCWPLGPAKPATSLLLRDAGDDDSRKHNGNTRVERVPLQKAKQHLGVRSHEHARGQRNAHDRCSHSGGPHVVDRLEVLGEWQLAVLRLQSVSAPLVARGGDDAREEDGEAEGAGLGKRRLRRKLAREHGAHEAAGPAVDDVASDGGDVGLVQESGVDVPAHALAEAVVGDREHDGAEEPAVDDTAHGAREGREAEHHVDDLEDRELQHVRGEGREEELRHHVKRDLAHGRAEGHALHQEAVHDGLRACRENCSHHGRRGALRRGANDLGEEAVLGRLLRGRVLSLGDEAGLRRRLALGEREPRHARTQAGLARPWEGLQRADDAHGQHEQRAAATAAHAAACEALAGRRHRVWGMWLEAGKKLSAQKSA